ncbi:hypothetical protein GGI12_003287 [Dipsacomyces acuminosporus]|nr:hypothetical protein GGI12_003287 [Dipsacomyces acuminosporus]
MALEPSEKQKKILAAKKKLKSFQAKRAAASPSQTVETNGQPDEASQDTSAPATAGDGAEHADQAPAPASADAGASLHQSQVEEVDLLSKELGQLKLQINEQREQLKAENKQSRMDLQASNAKYAELEASSAARQRELLEQLEQAKHNLQLAANQAAEDKGTIDAANAKAQLLAEDIEALKNDHAAAMEDANSKHLQQLAERETELAEVHKGEVAQLNMQLTERDTSISDLQSEAEAARKAHEAEVAQLAAKAEEAALAAKEDAEQHDRHLKQVTAQLESAEGHIETGNAQRIKLEALNSELGSKVSELETLVSDTKDKLDALHSQFQQAKESYAAAEAESQARRELLEGDIAEKTGSISQLESDLEHAKTAAADLERQLSEQHESNSTLTTHLSALQSKYDSETSKCQLLENELSEQGARIEALTTNNEDLESNVALLKAQIEEMQRSHNDKEQQWEDSRHVLSQRLEELRQELDQAVQTHQNEAASLNGKLDDAMAANKELEATCVGLQASLSAETAAGKEKQQRIQEREADIEHVTKMRDNIQSKHDKLVAAQKKSRDSIDRLTEEGAKLRQNLEAMEKLKDEVAAQAGADREAHAQQKAALEAGLAEAKDANAALSDELANLRASHEDLQIEAQAAKETFEELAQDHSDLEHKHSLLKARCDHLNKQLEKAITSTRAWITELHDASTRHQEEIEGWELSESSQ